MSATALHPAPPATTPDPRTFDCYRGAERDGDFLDHADWAARCGKTLADIEFEAMEWGTGGHVLGQFASVLWPWREDYYQQPCG